MARVDRPVRPLRTTRWSLLALVLALVSLAVEPAELASPCEVAADLRPLAESDRLLVSGRYGLHEPTGERVGEERFAVFATEDGGRRLLARLADPAGEIVIHQLLAAAGRASFVEILRGVENEERSCTRLAMSTGEGEEAAARSVTRGDATGTIEQTIDLSSKTPVGLPAASAVGWLWRQAGRPGTAVDLDVYFWAGAGKPAAGRLQPARLAPDGVESVEGGGETIEAQRIVLDLGGQESTWWLHPTLDVPVRGELESGARVVLESLDLAGDR